MNRKQLEKRVRNTLESERKSVDSLLNSISDSFYASVEEILKRKGKIIVTGVGKSGFIGMKIAATLTSLGHSAFYLNPIDALHGDAGMIDDGDVLIALSFSGNTAELLRLVKYAKKSFRIKIISITGNGKSELANQSDHTITIDVKDEGCPLGLAPMASTTCTLVVGDLLASALTSPEEFKDEHFAKYHPAGTLGLKLKKVKDVIKNRNRVPKVSENEALESALKISSDVGLGVVAIVDQKEKLIGAITDGDVRRILLEHDSPNKLEANKVMTDSPKSITIDDSLLDALHIMESHKITNLFVVDKFNKLLGLIHIHDILEDSI